jgi:hypothetical protein
MASRLNLQLELEELLGSRNVYYQPPETVKMKYDAIVYNLSDVRTVKANNKPYLIDKRYDVTIISRNSENGMAEKLIKHFNHISFDRRYIADNLYHDALTLYY